MMRTGFTLGLKAFRPITYREPRSSYAPFSARRAAAVFIVIGVMFGLLIFRVAYLQTAGRQQTIGKAERQQHQTTRLESRRGGIFDRNGFALALTIQKQDLFVDPRFMAGVSMRKTRKNLDGDGRSHPKAGGDSSIAIRSELAQELNDRATAAFCGLPRMWTMPGSPRFEKLNIPGLGFVPTQFTSYPMGSAGRPHPWRDREGRPWAGRHRAEVRQASQRQGRMGASSRTPGGRRLAIAADDYLPPQHGQHLILTIDANLQMIAEQELDRLQAISREKGRSGRDGPEATATCCAGQLAHVRSETIWTRRAMSFAGDQEPDRSV